MAIDTDGIAQELEYQNEGRHHQARLQPEVKMPADDQCDKDLDRILEHIAAQEQRDEDAARQVELRKGLPDLGESSMSKSTWKHWTPADPM